MHRCIGFTHTHIVHAYNIHARLICETLSRASRVKERKNDSFSYAHRFMYIHIHTYMHVYTCIHVYKYTHAHVHTCICACMHVVMS